MIGEGVACGTPKASNGHVKPLLCPESGRDVPPRKDAAPQDVLLLFSGGRDSSLAACILAEAGHRVHPFTTDNGTYIGSELSEHRFQELRRAFPDSFAPRAIRCTRGLFRRIALATIEDDFAEFHNNLIVVGDQLATLTEAIVYCLKNRLAIIASGYTAYQADSYPEQMPEAVPLFAALAEEHGVQYTTPVYNFTSSDQVKYELYERGLTTKSLEGTSLFADTFSTPTASAVVDYIKKKAPICNAFIRSRSLIAVTSSAIVTP